VGTKNQVKARGADWEGNLITLEMYDAKSKTTKFVPVFFASQGEQFIPEPVSGHTHYLLDSEDNCANLYAFLIRPGCPARGTGVAQNTGSQTRGAS
jgi:hypothetical protein